MIKVIKKIQILPKVSGAMFLFITLGFSYAQIKLSDECDFNCSVIKICQNGTKLANKSCFEDCMRQEKNFNEKLGKCEEIAQAGKQKNKTLKTEDSINECHHKISCL